MYKKKLLAISLCLTILILSSTSLADPNFVKDNDYFDSKESYVIEGVPYVEKSKVFSCDYAPLKTLFSYYGINLTFNEIYYFSGGGYSQGYRIPIKRMLDFPPRKLPHKFIFSEDLVVGGPDDYNFMANLHGLSFECIYPEKVVNHNKLWNEYWTNVKNNIKNDTPVMTMLDPLAWPPFREHNNITTPLSPLLRACCVTVLVGFNETNKTICVHDQYLGSEKGAYLWVNLTDFKLAIKRAYFELRETRYSMYVIKKISDPLPRKIIFDLAYKRNIEKMKGIKSAYDDFYIQKNFNLFGINALKAFRDDLKNKFIMYVPLYNIINSAISLISPSSSYSYPFYLMILYFEEEYKIKECISDLLLKNKELSKSYEKDALLLSIESNYWKNFVELTKELKSTILNNTIIKSIQLSKPILNEMVNTLDDIITIEKTILLEE